MFGTDYNYAIGTDYNYATGYEEFSIKLSASDGEQEPGQMGFKLLAKSVSGETVTVDYYPPVTSFEIEEAFAGVARANTQFALSTQRSTSDEIRALGERLYNSVWQSRITDLYHQSYGMAKEKGKNLRLRFVIDHPALAALPWEFLFEPSRKDFLTLSTRTPVAREWSWPTPTPAQPAIIEPPLRVLVVEAEVRPWDTGSAEEIAVLQGLGKSNDGLLEVVKVVHDASPKTLIAALTDESYNVLHLCLSGATDAVLARGTGTGSGSIAAFSTDKPSLPQSLVLMDEKSGSKTPQKVDLDILRKAISIHTDLQLINLSGDCTDWLASQLTKVSPATLGWRGLNTPEAYQSFSEGFYSALVKGLPLEAAVTQGRKEIDAKYPGGKEWGMPVFYLQTPDGIALRQPSKSTEYRYSSEFGPAVPSNPVTQREWTKLKVLLSVAEENYRVLLNEVSKYGDNVPEFVDSQVKLLQDEITHLTSNLERLAK